MKPRKTYWAAYLDNISKGVSDHSHVIPNLYEFQADTNVGKQTTLEPTDMSKKHFYPQKKVSHESLNQHEGVNDDRFLGGDSL